MTCSASGPRGAHLAKNLRQLDAAADGIIRHAHQRGARVVGGERVWHRCGVAGDHDQSATARSPIKLLNVCRNATGELLDPGTSRAFAVCDHQLAHVYCRDAEAAQEAQRLLANLDGVERVYAGADRAQQGLDHPRSGELVVLAARGAWFVYDYWLDPREAPDFARCVEIHKKPGYDPLLRELVFDRHGGKRRAAIALLRKKLGMRYVMSAIGSDTSVVKGSHGRPTHEVGDGPIFIDSEKSWERPRWHQRDVCGLIQQALS